MPGGGFDPDFHRDADERHRRDAAVGAPRGKLAKSMNQLPGSEKPIKWAICDPGSAA